MLLLVVALLALPSTAHARTWRWPAEGPVVRRFTFDRRDPYAKGRHRGIEIAAAPGAPVRAACAGRVRFAGTVPNHGRTVSVTCGPYTATYLQLSSVAVRRGQTLATGQRLGATGRRPFHFGIRRHTYVDPLSLLPSDPLGRAPPPSAPPPSRRPRPEPPPSMPAPIPPAAWAGLGLLGAAVPTLALVGGRRRRARAQARGPRALALRDPPG